MPKRLASASRYELQLSLLGRKNTMRPTVLLAFIVLYPLTTASFDIPISGMTPDVFLCRVVVGNLIIAPLLWLAGLQIDRMARTSIRDLPRFTGVDPQAARELREEAPAGPQTDALPA